jgi:LuxR family maltose regulon positive regulatory protein
MPPPLLTTKLYIPPIRPELVSRPRLIERLNAGIYRKLTLISAPAGFGKTTLVSEWVASCERPATWLSLDEGDNDSTRFLTYLVAALQTLALPALSPVEGNAAKVGEGVLGVLQSPQPPPTESILTALLNEIAIVPDNFVLVLDDYHVIDTKPIDNALTFLLEHLPSQMHLVIATREDPPLPLARLRANNQLTEIRAADLRFASPEAERFLNEVMGLSLSPTDIAVLEDKTEGWIVGLQLAGLSVRDRADPSSFIGTLSGSHRFILSYLTEEVLSRQPEEIQSFLLQTSILNRLSGDLCNAVTGRTDGRVLLERLLNANLFLVPLDDEQQWYRYHHLFADLLRDLQNAFQQDKTAELHQRASHWYALAGMASEAIRHALAAEDYATAVDLLESHATGMIMQGYAKTVNGWVQAIPAEWGSLSPRTNLAFAWMHLLRGTYAQASPYMEQVQAAFSGSQVGLHLGAEENPSLKAEWLAVKSLLLNMQGRATESMTMATRALEIAPEEDSHARSLAYFGLAGVYQLMEDYTHAVEAYQMAIRHGQAAENLVAEMMSTAGLAVMAFEHGQLHLAFEIAAPVSARVEQSGSLPPISTVVYGILGEVYYQWCQIEQARRHILRALQLSTLGGYKSGMINCRVLLSRLSQLEGDLEAAAREVQEAIDQLQVDTPGYVRQEAVSQQVRVYLARNRPAAAELALQGQGFSFRDQFSFPGPPPDQSLSHANGLLYNSSLCVLLHQARARRDLTGLRQGIELADRLVAGALQGQYLIVALEALLLRAQVRAALGDHRASLADYARALELAEPEGFIGVFVEQGPPVAETLANLVKQDRLRAVQPGYIERILAAFSRLQPSGTTRGEQPAPDLPAGNGLVALIEPLTDRELDVLRLMVEGLKYKEIAARLFISLNTVRFHVKAIYGKLNVNNRTQAIEMARQLQIL